MRWGLSRTARTAPAAALALLCAGASWLAATAQTPPHKPAWSKAIAAAKAKAYEVPVPLLTGVKTADLPDYEGYPADYAMVALRRAGFTDVRPQLVHSDRPKGVVDTQSPKSQSVQLDTPVSLSVSDGTPAQGPPESQAPPPPSSAAEQSPPSSEAPPPSSSESSFSGTTPVAAVPMGFIRDFEGFPVDQARDRLETVGFPITVSYGRSGEPRGTVVGQTPANRRAPLGTLVELVVSEGPPPPPRWLLPAVLAAGLGALAGAGYGVSRSIVRRRLNRLLQSVSCRADPPVPAGPPALEDPEGKPLAVVMRAELSALPSSLETSS